MRKSGVRPFKRACFLLLRRKSTQVRTPARPLREERGCRKENAKEPIKRATQKPRATSHLWGPFSSLGVSCWF